MINRITRTLLTLGTSALLLSCQKESSSGSDGCSNTTGWVKDGHEFVYVNEPIYIFADSLYISLDEVSPGVFKSTSLYDDGSMFPATSNYIQPCGKKIFQASTPALTDKQEAYRTDGNVGDSWSTVSSTGGGISITNTTTITGKNVSVTVPAGTFTCLKLTSLTVPSNPQYGTIETNFYLNNQYGIIKVEGNTAHYELARINFK